MPIKGNKTALYLPFKGEWVVFWGGDTKKLNAHYDIENQRFAFDFGILDTKGKSYKGQGKKNKDYYCFGKEILAPADGIVIETIDGVRDNKPGSMNPYSAIGNAVVIKHSKKEFSVFAHLEQNSIKVKPKDKVKQGQVIGLCGNSGNSSEPHLHYHLQDSEIIQEAKGIKCYFKDIIVKNKKGKIYKKEYSPIKGDIISSR